MAEAAPFSAQWTPNLEPLAHRLTQLGEQVIAAVHRGIEQNARLMAAELKQLTPRSDGDGPHVADGWMVRQIDALGGRDAGGRFVGKADFAVEVYNADPRWDATIDTSTGGTTSLGRILEFGSRPHEIRARPGGVLRFYWPAVGDIVTAKSVEHPGTRAYGMMAISTDAAISRGQRLLAAAARVLRGEVT